MLHHLHPPAPTDPASEAHRHAYNSAFEELDLPWHWDAPTFARLQPAGRAGIRHWIESEQPHLLRAYTADFLLDVIEATQARCHARLARAVAQRRPHDIPRLAA